MSVSLSHFGLGLDVPFIEPNSSRSFCPPSWPPPKDWVCIEDKGGNAISHYGDSVWDFTPWCRRSMKFSFGDGPKLNARSPVIDPCNAEILRQLVAWRAWGPRATSEVLSLINNFAKPIRTIINLCSQNNILAINLSRHPKVIDEVAKKLAPSKYDKIVAELERLRDAREALGFELLDASGIQRLKAAQPEHGKEQTEYIPPRIWGYVVNRVAECINEYSAHLEQIESCFAFCIRAYEENGAVEYRERTGKAHRNPFQAAVSGNAGKRSGVTYHGHFVDTAQRFGIKELIERWSSKTDIARGISGFSKYLQIVQYAALVDIVAFTLMRIDEATSVRSDCLLWHDDPVYGRIPLIRSETTKTDPDDSGLWITSPSVETAIRVLQSIAKLRNSRAERTKEMVNPRLISPAFEPWARSRKSLRQFGAKPSVLSLAEVVRAYPCLLDLQELTITEEDFKIAKSVCPTLDTELFRVGRPWHLAWHQFRRTGAVNMFASGKISDSTMQLQLKHLTRWQPLYYGRGNTALRLNDAARVLLVNAQYEAMGRQLAEVHTDRFVSPYGDEHKANLFASGNRVAAVNLISEGDAKHYEKAARKHQINFRLTVLGGCMKNGQCDGDCVSSVGDCAGGDGKAPCINVLFDRTRALANQTRLDGVIKQLERVPQDSPRFRSLEQEKRGLENYFAYIRN
jgi:hypothetical protein